MTEGPLPDYASFDAIVEAFPDRFGDGASWDGGVWAAEEPDGEWRKEREKKEQAKRHTFVGLLEQFQERESGRIESSYFGRVTRNGAALVASLYIREGSRILPRHLRGPRREVVYKLFTKLDLVGAKDAAALASRCEHVRVIAEELLDGEERQRVIRLVYERLVQLFRALDDATIAAHSFQEMEASDWVHPEESSEARSLREQKEARERELQEKREEEARRQIEQARANALTVIQADIVQTEGICQRAVRRRALMAYFYGMLVGVAIFTALASGVGYGLGKVDISGFDLAEFITTFVAGAVGAIVSVMSRMSSGKLEIEYETRRSFLALLGGFRPLIGGIFGVALYFGMSSGILPIEPPAQETETFFFFAFLAFLAGFSERWAQDMFVTSQRAVGPAPTEQRI